MKFLLPLREWGQDCVNYPDLLEFRLVLYKSCDNKKMIIRTDPMIYGCGNG